MTRQWLLVAAIVVLGACGGGAEPVASSGDADGGAGAPTSGTDDSGSTGAVVNRQPPGQGMVSVDGQEFTSDTPGAVACVVSDDEFSFSFIIGDNEVVFGGGASVTGEGWFGNLSLQVATADSLTEYFAKLNENPSGIAIDGASVSYSGPMEKYLPAEPGELPQPVDVGDGFFTATCA